MGRQERIIKWDIGVCFVRLCLGYPASLVPGILKLFLFKKLELFKNNRLT